MTDTPRHGEGDRGAQRRGGGASAPRVPSSIERARKLRRTMSYPEVLLWRLRGSPGGLRFRRQHPIGLDYTADFYCSAARLVIEVDGLVHAAETARAYDAGRDRFMRDRGLEVVRVPAVNVLRDAASAAAAVFALAADRVSRGERPSTTPLMRRGPPPRTGEEQGT